MRTREVYRRAGGALQFVVIGAEDLHDVQGRSACEGREMIEEVSPGVGVRIAHAAHVFAGDGAHATDAVETVGAWRRTGIQEQVRDVVGDVVSEDAAVDITLADVVGVVVAYPLEVFVRVIAADEDVSGVDVCREGVRTDICKLASLHFLLPVGIKAIEGILNNQGLIARRAYLQKVHKVEAVAGAVLEGSGLLTVREEEVWLARVGLYLDVAIKALGGDALKGEYVVAHADITAPDDGDLADARMSMQALALVVKDKVLATVADLLLEAFEMLALLFCHGRCFEN